MIIKMKVDYSLKQILLNYRKFNFKLIFSTINFAKCASSLFSCRLLPKYNPAAAAKQGKLSGDLWTAIALRVQLLWLLVFSAHLSALCSLSVDHLSLSLSLYIYIYIYEYIYISSVILYIHSFTYSAFHYSQPFPGLSSSLLLRSAHLFLACVFSCFHISRSRTHCCNRWFAWWAYTSDNW